MQENEALANSAQSVTSNLPNNSASEDVELKAINAIVAALSGLKEEQRLRALEYVLRRFNAVALQPVPVAAAPSAFQAAPSVQPGPFGSVAPQMIDIRSLKEAKQPKSANEMAALVAFYLSEVASQAERKDEIGKADIERYFKLANFKLTANAGQTLVNAKNAGYLDAGSGAGQYKINPVGYNLVAHRMGSAESEPRRRRPKTAPKKNGKKSARPRK
jgi:hypothetical protein